MLYIRYVVRHEPWTGSDLRFLILTSYDNPGKNIVKPDGRAEVVLDTLALPDLRNSKYLLRISVSLDQYQTPQLQAIPPLWMLQV